MASSSLRAATALLFVLANPTACLAMCTTAGCEDKHLGDPGDLELADGAEGDQAFLEFDSYSKNFDRKYEHDSKEYWLRRGLFEKRSAEVKEQNSKPDRLWEAVAGPFADYTDAERAYMRGYRSAHSRVGPSSGGMELPREAMLMREQARPVLGNATMPMSFSWLDHLKEALRVPDQGQCGSCWAVTAASVLNLHHELHVRKYTGEARHFSAQQIVSCVPNERKCGGTGGCEGSTVELAFDWALHSGCADETSVPYQAKDLAKDDAKCGDSKLLSLSPHSLMGTATNLALDGGNAFGMLGYHMLERNNEKALKEALYQLGPVASSTAAKQWYEYSHGVFDGCPNDVVVDHAVTLMGFGEAANKEDAGNTQPEKLMPVLGQTTKVLLSTRSSETPIFKAPMHSPVKYWLIRNSWGKSWGEGGFIRMLRDDQEGQHCGTDNNNQEGTGCAGDNKTVSVCGMCGFLWDSVVPHFHAGGSGADGSAVDPTFLQVDHSAKFVRREQ